MRNAISWLLKESEGVTALDKCILFFIKAIYLAVRILLRIALGKKTRDRIYIKRGYDFGIFWNKAFNLLRRTSNNYTLLRFKMPKYGYEFYCRNNKDDFKVMTIHEDEIIERFTPKKGDIVVDIGAHIGLFTIIASKRVGINGKVIAIEAHPDSFDILNRNIQLNGLTNVITLQYAVYSSKKQKMKLYLPGAQSGFTKLNTVMTDRAQTTEEFVEVYANTLDNLLEQHQQNGIKHEDVNWIKVDVEGAEFEVLKGATDVLSKTKDIALLIEVHNLHDGTNHYKDIMDFLSFYEFRIEFEKTYENGEKHIIVRKSNRFQKILFVVVNSCSLISSLFLSYFSCFLES